MKILNETFELALQFHGIKKPKDFIVKGVKSIFAKSSVCKGCFAEENIPAEEDAEVFMKILAERRVLEDKGYLKVGLSDSFRNSVKNAVVKRGTEELEELVNAGMKGVKKIATQSKETLGKKFLSWGSKLKDYGEKSKSSDEPSFDDVE